MHVELSIEDLKPFFHLPLCQVAKHFGLCITSIKKQCRILGIPRWPFRKFKSINYNINKMQQIIEDDPKDENAKSILKRLEKTKIDITNDPSIIGTKTNCNPNLRIKKIIAKKQNNNDKKKNLEKQKKPNDKNKKKNIELSDLQILSKNELETHIFPNLSQMNFNENQKTDYSQIPFPEWFFDEKQRISKIISM